MKCSQNNGQVIKSLKKMSTIEKKTKKSKKLKKWLKNSLLFYHFSSEKMFYTNKTVIKLYS